MWVIFSKDTGQEVDRIEDYDEALSYVRDLNDNEFGFEYGKRWED